MKKLLMAVVVFVATICVSLPVMADSFGESDIERIYIEGSSLAGLTKEYVAATVYAVNKDGSVQIYDDNAKVKLRGNSTSKAEKKPFKIKFASKQSLFGMDEGKSWNVLANAFDKTLMRNKLAFDLATDMGVKYVSQSTFCDVYYNDELLGNYLVTEPVEAGSNKVDIGYDDKTKDFMIEIERERYESDVTYINSKAGVRFAINEPEEPTDAQVKDATAVINQAETAMKTGKMSEYSKYIDVDSFVNYYIVSEIFKAVDFNYSSTRFFYKDGKLYAGPIWDVDLSSGNASKRFYKDYYEGDISYKKLFCTEMKWYKYLMSSDEFVKLVKKRFAAMKNRIANMYQDNVLGNSQIKQFTTKYAGSFARNYASKADLGAGWSLTKRYSVCDNPIGLEFDNHPSTFAGSVDMLSNWLDNRVKFLETDWASIHNMSIDFLEATKKSATQVKLEWYNSGVFDGIEVYAKAGKDSYKLIKTIKDDSTTEYIAKVKPGVKYTFKLRAFVQSYDGILYSDYATVSKKLTLSKPSFKIKRKGSKAKLTWKKVKGAEGYIVYGGKSKGKLKKLKVLKKNKLKYTKKTSKKYYFCVKAYVKVGKKYYTSKGCIKK